MVTKKLITKENNYMVIFITLLR